MLAGTRVQVVSNRIVIIGGGIGGLALVLALRGHGYQTMIIERDPEPPDIRPEHAFEQWRRAGVPQFRHAHMLLSRLQTIIRDHYPDLLQQLLDAGLELAKIEESMPIGVAEQLQPRPEDEDLRHLWGRRATFEYVLYRYVEKLPDVSFRHRTQVTGLLSDLHEGEVAIRGVETLCEQERAQLMADVVVDATGKRSRASEWLQELGVSTEVRGAESGFIYACRHYRLQPGAEPPPRIGCGGNLDYIGYAAFFAEHGHYALTIGSPVDETELTSAMNSIEGFECITSQFPSVRVLQDTSEATSKVLGAGRFTNCWRRYGTSGGNRLVGFFAVGDSHLETNPMYGRGCASAFVQAHVLADVLRTEQDPARRTARYNAETFHLLNPFYEASLATDHFYHARARQRRGLPVPMGDRLVSYLYDAAFVPATHESPLVAREFVKLVQMRKPSRIAVRTAAAWLILRALLRTWMGRKVAAVSPPPDRSEFIARIRPQQEKAS